MSMHDLCARLEDIRQRIAELKMEETELVAEIVGVTGGTGVFDYEDDSVVRVEQPMKFSAAQAQQVLPPDLLKAVMVPSVTISAGMAKKLLPSEIYDKCKIPNGNVRIKIERTSDD